MNEYCNVEFWYGLACPQSDRRKGNTVDFATEIAQVSVRIDAVCLIGITYSLVERREERTEVPLGLPMVLPLTSPTGGPQWKGSNLTVAREFPLQEVGVYRIQHFAKVPQHLQAWVHVNTTTRTFPALKTGRRANRFAGQGRYFSSELVTSSSL
jgi:hypothetical protein